MAATKYTFSKEVNSPRLQKEIQDSAIVVALDYIQTSGSNLDIWFKDVLSASDETLLGDLVTSHINAPLPELPIPVDQDGSPLSRIKVTKAGWHYQAHGIDILTAKVGGGSNFYIDPITFQKVDLGFVTTKIYKSDGGSGFVEITDQAEENLALVTVVEWMVNHDMEIKGGQLSQSAPPATDVFFQAYNKVPLPPTYTSFLHVPFTTGAINLKHFGQGSIINADGEAAKFIPNGAGKFVIMFHHNAGVSHEINMLFELFKSMT